MPLMVTEMIVMATVAGIVGGFMACLLYLLLIAGKLAATSKLYLYGQLATTVFMLSSLSVNFNAGAVMINAFWFIITLSALGKRAK